MQALDLFRTVAPTIVTLDVSVPHPAGLGSLALFRMMRSEKPGLPILVVSASAYPEIRKAFLREGALDYIVKPFAASSFEQVCNRLVGMFPELVRVGRRSGSTAPNPIEIREIVTDRADR